MIVVIVIGIAIVAITSTVLGIILSTSDDTQTEPELGERLNYGDIIEVTQNDVSWGALNNSASHMRLSFTDSDTHAVQNLRFRVDKPDGLQNTEKHSFFKLTAIGGFTLLGGNNFKFQNKTDYFLSVNATGDFLLEKNPTVLTFRFDKGLPIKEGNGLKNQTWTTGVIQDGEFTPTLNNEGAEVTLSEVSVSPSTAFRFAYGQELQFSSSLFRKDVNFSQRFLNDGTVTSPIFFNVILRTRRDSNTTTGTDITPTKDVTNFIFRIEDPGPGFEEDKDHVYFKMTIVSGTSDGGTPKHTLTEEDGTETVRNFKTQDFPLLIRKVDDGDKRLIAVTPGMTLNGTLMTSRSGDVFKTPIIEGAIPNPFESLIKESDHVFRADDKATQICIDDSPLLYTVGTTENEVKKGFINVLDGNSVVPPIDFFMREPPEILLTL